MGLTNMNLLFLCLLAPIILTSVDTSLAAPSLFDDTYDPAYHEFFSDDQTDQNRAAFEDPLEFTTSLINIQDFSPIASDDHLDWTTDDTTYLDSSGDYFASQLNVDFVTANPACSYDEFSIQGFEKRGQLFPNSCPNPLAPDADTPPSNRKKKQTPTIEPAEPASPPGLNNPGRPFFEHADLGDFYSNRDRDTIQGYSPGKESNSPCGKAQYTVCDSGDPYWRIPQVPPLFALERCFVYTSYAPFPCYAPSLIWCCQKYYASLSMDFILISAGPRDRADGCIFFATAPSTPADPLLDE